MGIMEIIFISLGILLLVVSCLIPEKETAMEVDYDALVQRLSRRELSKEEKEEIKRVIDSTIIDCTEKAIVQTDDYLSKVSNEKILSVNEFSEQIIEKIETNHKEVIFLYNMLTDKEEELKETISQLTDLEKQVRSVAQEFQVKKEGKPTEGVGLSSGMERLAKKVSFKTQVSGLESKEVRLEEKAVVTENKETTVLEDENNENKTKEILELYAQGKTVMQISKELGLGQGEVRLIVDLYSKNK